MESPKPPVKKKIVIVEIDPADEIIVFAQNENIVRTKFIWQQQIDPLPLRYEADGDIFTDRIFDVKTKTGDIIKISTSLSYDRPLVFFKAKVTEGADLMKEILKISFSYSYKGCKGCWGAENCSDSTTKFQQGSIHI